MSVGLPELMIILFLGVFGVGGTLLWIWMLIDCATKESSQDNEKVVWILFIVFTHWIGALIYLVVRRPKRIELLGA
jgi:hypothetical protein